MRTEGFVQRAGVRLRYVEWSPNGTERRPALFLLHGLSSNALVWGRLAARLPHRRIVALDQRSHGSSDRPVAGYGVADLVQDAAHAIEALELGRPVVAGHSWGGSVALALAAARPELVSGLSLVDGGFAAMATWMTWEEAAPRMQPPLPLHRTLDEACAAQAVYLGEDWDEDLEEFVAASMAQVDGGFRSTLTAPVRLEILRSMYGQRPDALLRLAKGPLLLAVAGASWAGEGAEQFLTWKRRSIEAAMAARPDAWQRWYESRHDIPLIRPDELAADLERLAHAAELEEVARRAASLDGDWSRLAQGDAEGWTAKDLLAHLSSTQVAIAAIVATPPAPPDPAAPPRPPFDANRWNAGQVARRRDTPPEALISELSDATAAVRVGLLDADLAGPAPIGPYAGQALGRALAAMADHQRGHLEELSRALA